DFDRLGADLPAMLIGGRALVGRFLKAIGNYPNAKLNLNTPLVELVVEDGAVVGALVERDGEQVAIRARKGVILAAGGFEGNDELRQKYGVPGVARDTMGPW
ncbi:FAD-binding protein, partial [Prescottella equi]|uniref:FAD-binding protein n=1 Tax=Rhodococcus hoagii TaxID=43767 RepID=UPI00111C1DB3